MGGEGDCHDQKRGRGLRDRPAEPTSQVGDGYENTGQAEQSPGNLPAALQSLQTLVHDGRWVGHLRGGALVVRKRVTLAQVVERADERRSTRRLHDLS